MLHCFIFIVAMLFAIAADADSLVYLKLGNMNLDGKQKDHPLNLALNLGYELDNYVADFSIAAEINRSVDDGKLKSGGDLEFESNGVFLVYKSTRSLFVIGRIGYVENKIIERGSAERSNGVSLGGGIGVYIGRARVQLEFVSYAGDANQLSLGLQF